MTRNMLEGTEESSVFPSTIILCTKAQQKVIDLVARPGGIFVGKCQYKLTQEKIFVDFMVKTSFEGDMNGDATSYQIWRAFVLFCALRHFKLFQNNRSGYVVPVDFIDPLQFKADGLI